MGNIKQFSVKVKDKKDINKALKKWKRKYSEFGIKEDMVDRKEFKKPSRLKYEKRSKAIRQHQREELKRKENE